MKKLKFYVRIAWPCRWVNMCLVFDGWKRPYVCYATSIRGNMEFAEINIG